MTPPPAVPEDDHCKGEGGCSEDFGFQLKPLRTLCMNGAIPGADFLSPEWKAFPPKRVNCVAYNKCFKSILRHFMLQAEKRTLQNKF